MSIIVPLARKRGKGEGKGVKSLLGYIRIRAWSKTGSDRAHFTLSG